MVKKEMAISAPQKSCLQPRMVLPMGKMCHVYKITPLCHKEMVDQQDTLCHHQHPRLLGYRHHSQILQCRQMGQGKGLSIEVRNKIWLREIYQPEKNSCEDASQGPKSMGHSLHLWWEQDSPSTSAQSSTSCSASENSQGLALVIDTSKDSATARSQIALPVKEKPLFGSQMRGSPSDMPAVCQVCQVPASILALVKLLQKGPIWSR